MAIARANHIGPVFLGCEDDMIVHWIAHDDRWPADWHDDNIRQRLDRPNKPFNGCVVQLMSLP